MSKQRGNILFLILLAVILFAALSYAVTNSMRGGGKNASSEKVEVMAAELLQYAASIKTAWQRMQLINGCQDDTISFDNPTSAVVHNYVNSRAPSSRVCHMFDPAGGGLTYKVLDSKFIGTLADSTASGNSPTILAAAPYPTFSGGNEYRLTSNTSNAEIMMVVPYINKAVCDAINKSQGITTQDINHTALSLTLLNTANPPRLAGQGQVYLNANVRGFDYACSYRSVADQGYVFFYVIDINE